jgi:hypothetical protein
MAIAASNLGNGRVDANIIVVGDPLEAEFTSTLIIRI